MKKIKNKGIFLILIGIVILISILVLVANKKEVNDSSQNNETKKENAISYVKEVEEGVQLNTSSKIREEKKLGDLTIKEAQLTTKSGMTSFLADVKNNGTIKTETKLVTVKLLNKNGEVLATLTGVINPLEPGGTTELNIATTSNYIESFDYTITEK